LDSSIRAAVLQAAVDQTHSHAAAAHLVGTGLVTAALGGLLLHLLHDLLLWLLLYPLLLCCWGLAGIALLWMNWELAAV
jgi:hypothetical protein